MSAFNGDLVSQEDSGEKFETGSNDRTTAEGMGNKLLGVEVHNDGDGNREWGD